MYRLAKLGFTQSYNYFPWRNTKDELTEYFTELTRRPSAEFFRPNLWPNTPDILTQFLQTAAGRRSRSGSCWRRPWARVTAFTARRLSCAKTPLANRAARNISNSEKYEIRHWNLNAPQSLERLDCQGEPDPPRKPRPAIRPPAGIPSGQQRSTPGLHQNPPRMAPTRSSPW